MQIYELLNAIDIRPEMYPRTHLWLFVLVVSLTSKTRSEDDDVQESTENDENKKPATADDDDVLADEIKTENEDEADEDSFLDSERRKKVKVSLPLSSRCRQILTVLNYQRRFAKSIDTYAIKAIEKFNGKIVATLVQEHINNAENTLLSKISGNTQLVRFKLREWLNSTLKLRELLLTAKLRGPALQFAEIMGNIARLVVELILCIYH